MNILHESTDNHLGIEDGYSETSKQEDKNTNKNENIMISKHWELADREEESSFGFVLGYN